MTTKTKLRPGLPVYVPGTHGAACVERLINGYDARLVLLDRRVGAYHTYLPAQLQPLMGWELRAFAKLEELRKAAE